MHRFTKNYDYAYPDGLNLKPDSELHSKLLSEINTRVREAYSIGGEARRRGESIDKVLYNFVTTDEKEDILKLTKENKIAAPTTIIIPISKAVLDTWVTYMANSFLSNPYGIYSLRGKGNKETAVKAVFHEILLNMQAIWFGHDNRLITFWKDCYAYGLGAIMPVWTKHKYKVPTMTQVTEELAELMNGKAKIGDIIKYIQEVTIHEGNSLTNIDFYSIFLDPNVSINESEKLEFAGFFEINNALDLLNKETDAEEQLFNCKYVKDLLSDGGYSERLIYDGRERYNTLMPGSKSYKCIITHFFWKLIPKDWGLGDSEYPEVYYFKIVNDEIIVSAVNVEYLSGSIPIVFGAPNTDGYDTYPISYIATTFGIQKYVDWKARSQVTNQAKVLNDMIIVDPFMIDMDDILNPGAGKIIRTKRNTYGEGGIERFIKQLNVNDVTQNNMSDISNIITLMYQILGTTDIMMGDLSRLPERPTAQGIMLARNSALSRLQKDAQILVSQMWYKLVFQMACNNMLFMSNDVAINIAGSKYQQLLQDYGIEGENIVIAPSDISMEFDISSINKFQQETNIQAMSIFIERALAYPEIVSAIMQSYNIPAIFRNYMRKIGFDNIDDFSVNQPTQTQVMPDEVVQNELQKGNIVPVSQ